MPFINRSRVPIRYFSPPEPNPHTPQQPNGQVHSTKTKDHKGFICALPDLKMSNPRTRTMDSKSCLLPKISPLPSPFSCSSIGTLSGLQLTHTKCTMKTDVLQLEDATETTSHCRKFPLPKCCCRYSSSSLYSVVGRSA